MHKGTNIQEGLLNKPYLCKWGHFEKAKPTFKMLLAPWAFDTVEKNIRFLNAENLGSIGQRAAKLLAVNVRGLKKSLPAGPGPSRTSQPDSSSRRVESFSKFDGQ